MVFFVFFSSGKLEFDQYCGASVLDTCRGSNVAINHTHTVRQFAHEPLFLRYLSTEKVAVDLVCNSFMRYRI